MHFFRFIEHFAHFAVTQVPLEVFVFCGSFLEEVISPIPSALIMGTAGSLALLHHETLWYLVLLALIGNVGKSLGAWIYYFIGDKLEDLLVKKITKFFGVRHEEIENIGKRFVGHHWKDGGMLFFLRLIPFVPTTPVSIAAGIIKMDVRVFLGATYLGNFLKDLVYLYVGYSGLAVLHTLWRRLAHYKVGVDIAVAVLIVGFLIFLYMHRGTGKLWLVRYQAWREHLFVKDKK